MKRAQLQRATIALGLVDCVLVAVLVSIMCAASTQPSKHEPIKNAYYPFTVETSILDRPLLSTRQQIETARATGICSFHIGNEHYIVTDLPKEYIDYSARCGRML